MTVKYERISDCRCEYCAQRLPKKVYAIFALAFVVTVAGIVIAIRG